MCSKTHEQCCKVACSCQTKRKLVVSENQLKIQGLGIHQAIAYRLFERMRYIAMAGRSRRRSEYGN